MNDNYSDHFIGRLYMPAKDKVVTFTGEKIKQGNKQAADYYQGKELKFVYSGLKIIPQSDKQAAVSYYITHQAEGKCGQSTFVGSVEKRTRRGMENDKVV
ncbi:hypothetical protein ERJ70_07085 [Sediminibacillus dalangtanensis]|uniref:Uncharacterized protein n=1 Tax=Sediminibacillus dalangtanensis TaxID=2729421 RepID=A0ABX7VSU9_9BACI|nr:hypothetical protein [Sediminibacillus dalangtanensis]QTM99084.1 hypothetical protein ERJ70_07085 [Sediminibacillus dalangtanensis]